MFILWFRSRLFNTCYLVCTILGTEDTCLPLYKSIQGAFSQLKIQILSFLYLKLFILTTLRIPPNSVHRFYPPYRPGNYCTPVTLAALFLVLPYAQLLFLLQVFFSHAVPVFWNTPYIHLLMAGFSLFRSYSVLCSSRCPPR